ncbi:hypothetical protein L3Q82_013332 [Scortum barcoo]|uniref:Uncharacterized protein n=1 Tax=Scortum barcoo TaxID=214431 RepID=A0ACB8W097_9TELE|nr:hypothetical protein L3Q82_013332 [Scortum barcoo]
MREKAKPGKDSSGAGQGGANIQIKSRENTHLKVGRPTKTPKGKGLGKAGAKRLGRLLKRALPEPAESAAGSRMSLPKTPVRLFKHQVQTEAKNAPKADTAKPTSHHVSQLILSVVSQCKHRGGMSMAELKQTLAAGGFNVTKNKKQVNMVTKRLINNETLVPTTRNVSFKLNNKKQTDTKRATTSSLESPRPKRDLKQSKTGSKSPKRVKMAKRQDRKTPKPKSKTRRAAAKSHKRTRKTPKAATKTHKPRGKTPRARRLSKSVQKRRRAAKRKAAQFRKAPRRSQSSLRHQPKQRRYGYKSSQKRQPPRRRHPDTRSRYKTQRRQVGRKRAYYYSN